MRIKSHLSSKVAIDMTPMIDVIFQLLSFFIMTLRIGSPEGDFSLQLPQASAAAGLPDTRPLPIKLRLRADAAGNLTDLLAGERSFTGPGRFASLTSHIEDLVAASGGAPVEVEIDCDYGLKYEHVMAAITAVSGKLAQGQIVKLAERITFAPPRGP